MPDRKGPVNLLSRLAFILRAGASERFEQRSDVQFAPWNDHPCCGVALGLESNFRSNSVVH